MHKHDAPVMGFLALCTLDEMAADWLDDLYRKAGKQSPWKNMG